MVDINKINSSVLLSQLPKTQQPSDIETTKPTAMVVNHHHQLLDIMDDMSMAMSQFNRRQDLQKKQQDSSDITSRILEDNVDKKLATAIKLLNNQKNKLADILTLLRQFFPDDSDFVSVLKELLRRRYFSAALALEIEAEINSLCQGSHQRAKATRAGINIALKAKQFSYQTALSAMQLRQLYRDFISQDIEPLWFYEEWVNQYGYDKRFLIIDFVLQSLLCDMQALSPSCSFMPEFAVYLSSLGRIKQLSSADKIFFAYCSNLPFLIQPDAQVSWLPIFIKGLSDPEAMMMIIQDIIANKQLTIVITQHILLLQQLMTAFKSLTIEIYLSPEIREKTQSYLLALLDLLYQKEKSLSRL
ncbi:type III secretion system gatekeeper subunit SctW [Arsenophonus apicola]|uniref:Type III secretion system gatekeeper subunit SctW n=1 Tax=Arsenophonus apicola TaxID=2879119 RepID=A0ABY8P2Y2_9GAMM|nr:type III secretion system gatekeeper subunit SctW [Arsenophonus apicola]WGO83858.1 type III secretion system gatekeeper subunit SctW [Arsenophonus apicola]